MVQSNKTIYRISTASTDAHAPWDISLVTEDGQWRYVHIHKHIGMCSTQFGNSNKRGKNKIFKQLYMASQWLKILAKLNVHEHVRVCACVCRWAQSYEHCKIGSNIGGEDIICVCDPEQGEGSGFGRDKGEVTQKSPAMHMSCIGIHHHLSGSCRPPGLSVMCSWGLCDSPASRMIHFRLSASVF